jgi:two-component system, chemotaxis family, protein-glutamate methylesterase/glutaminase
MVEQNLPVDEQNEQLDGNLPFQRIIVIGASAGGFEALKILMAGLPRGFTTPIFIVWHMSPDVPGILPQVLNKANTIVAAHAYNNEVIQPNRVYIAPPDHHLLIDEGKVLVTHGPKENRFRPAVDPLFRSAAYTYGNKVIGVILSGALDDGTAGLWAVKHYGGIAIVQDPRDAEVPSMPENAMREVAIDHCVQISQLPELLVRLSTEPITNNVVVMKDEQTKKEIQIAAEESGMKKGIMKFGELSPYTCPECHGVLSILHNDNIVRYRCHTGHAYSADALMASITEKIEDSLYSAIRGMDENIILLNHLGDHSAEANQPKLAALYFQKAKEVQERSEPVRKAALVHQQLNKDVLRKEAEG